MLSWQFGVSAPLSVRLSACLLFCLSDSLPLCLITFLLVCLFRLFLRLPFCLSAPRPASFCDTVWAFASLLVCLSAPPVCLPPCFSVCLLSACLPLSLFDSLCLLASLLSAPLSVCLIPGGLDRFIIHKLVGLCHALMEVLSASGRRQNEVRGSGRYCGC